MKMRIVQIVTGISLLLIAITYILSTTINTVQIMVPLMLLTGIVTLIAAILLLADSKQ